MTNEVDGGSGHPLDAALSLVHEGLAALADLALWQLDQAQLRVLAAGLDRAGLLAQAQLVRLLGEADSRGLPGQDGTRTSGAWLRSVVPTMGPGEAAGLGRRADRLYRSALSADLTPTREALLAGQVRPDHERVITDTITHLSPPVVPADGPDALDPDQVAAAQALLVGEAAKFTARDLAKLATAITHHLDPNADDRLARDETAQHRQRCLTLSREASGMTFVQGLLTKECGAALRTAIDAWSAPQPATDGTPDPRTPAQRRHDALHHLTETTLATGQVPTSHGSPAKVIVRVDLTTLTAALAEAGGAGPWAGRAGPGSRRQASPGEQSAEGPARPATPPGHDAPRPLGPPAELDDGTPISRQTLARIVCDADLVPVLLDDLAHPLDVGRTVRAFTARQRTAIIERDRHCTWPGCTAPAAWCKAHHLTYWEHGGNSDLDNAALVCGHHHRHIHATSTTGKVVNGEVIWNDTATTPDPPPKPPRPHRLNHLTHHLIRQWLTPRWQ